MVEITSEKREALEVMNEYLGKLIPGVETVIQELKEERKPDTDEYVKSCLDGINWVIEIYNRTSDVINAEEEKIKKEEINPTIMDLGKALEKKEDLQIAEALKGVVVFLKKLYAEAAQLV